MTVERINDSQDPEIQAILAVKLPDWLDLPEFKEVQTMRAVDTTDGFKIEFAQGPGVYWDTPVEAYDAADNMDVDIEFDDSLNRPEWGELSGGLYFSVEPKNRLLISSTDADKLFLLKGAMQHFLDNNEAYQKNPDDFAYAYNWLATHPAFWRRHKVDSSGPTLDWETADGFYSLWTHVDRKPNGDVTVMFEHGSAVPPERVMHYHDARLDVFEPTFEAAYITLAKLVDRYFNLDGTDKNESND